MKTEDFKANEYYRHVAMAQVIFIYEIRSTPNGPKFDYYLWFAGPPNIGHWGSMNTWNPRPGVDYADYVHVQVSQILTHHPLYIPGYCPVPPGYTHVPAANFKPAQVQFKINGQVVQPAMVTLKYLLEGTPTKAKCECGSAKCGSSFHSDWCPARS
jgi:hypothetical protein